MAEPKKRNGKWHGTVYSHTENGKRIYQSITADTKAEWYAAEKEFKAKKALGEKKESVPNSELTVRQVLDKYIALHALLSPTTLDGYRKIQRTTFADIMDQKIKNLDNESVQLAINKEASRITRRGTTVSPKTIKNSWFLIATAINDICEVKFKVVLPKEPRKFYDIPTAADIMPLVHGLEIELPCLLAMRLSLSMSEIRGLKCSSYRKGNIYVERVVVDTKAGQVVKEVPKADKRTRVNPCPSYIADLIEALPNYQAFQNGGEDTFLIGLNAEQIRLRFKRLMKKNGIEGVTFHTLRHIFASTGAYLQVPDIYIQSAGGWKTDYTMKRHYTQTFSDGRTEAERKYDEYFLSIMQTKMQTKK